MVFMASQVITPHKIGWAKNALDVRKAAEKKHKENRKKAFKAARKKFGGLFSSGWEELKGEFTNPWNLLPPIFILRVGIIKPLRGLGAIIGYAVSTPMELLEARKKSLSMKKGSTKMVAYSLIGEMQRDPALKKKISDLVKKDGLNWLYVNSGGQIVLSDNAKYSPAKLEEKYMLADPPRVDMSQLLPRTDLTFVEVKGTPDKTMAALRGNTVVISKMGKAGSEETIHKNKLNKVKIKKTIDPKILAIQFELKDGTIRKIEIKKDEAIKIFKTMKK